MSKAMSEQYGYDEYLEDYYARSKALLDKRARNGEDRWTVIV